MSDNYNSSSSPRLGLGRERAHSEFVDLVGRLRRAGLSWAAIAGGLEMAQAHVDEVFLAMGERYSRNVAMRRTARDLEPGAPV